MTEQEVLFSDSPFSWSENHNGDELLIERGRTFIVTVVREIARQAIGLARQQSGMPHEQGVPDDEELQRLVPNMPDGVFGVLPGVRPVVNIDYLGGLPVKLVIYRGESGTFRLLKNLFDSNHVPGASSSVLRRAMVALDLEAFNKPKE